MNTWKIKPVAKIDYVSPDITASGWGQRYSGVYMNSPHPDWYQAPWVPAQVSAHTTRVQPRPLGPPGHLPPDPVTRTGYYATGSPGYGESPDLVVGPSAQNLGSITVASAPGAYLYAIGHVLLALGALALFK